MKKFIQEYIFILIIMAVAFGLRFWEFWSIPYQHDELSALLRTYLNGWSDFIETGVKRDNHPAGTQFLLWGMTKIGGYASGWIKLPFLLAGVWSVWLTYAFASRISGRPAALISSAILATMQLHITYSQWARPYILGLCAVLAVGYVMLRIRENEYTTKKWYVWLFLGIVSSAYVHYFALLQVILIVCLGSIKLSRKKTVIVMTTSLVAAIVFSLHIPITVHHLNRGGIGEWLQPKYWDYWLEVISYMVNYSWWVGGLVLALCLPGFLRLSNFLSPSRLGLLLLGTLPYIIAYSYSSFVNPLLHQGVLFFSMPFFVVWLASFTRWNQPLVGLATMLLLAISSTAVAKERLHYFLNYQSEYETSISWLNTLLHEDQTEVGLLLDIRQDFAELYQNWGLIESEDLVFADELWDQNRLQQYLDEQDAPYFFFAMTNATRPDLLAAVIDHYPCIEEVRHFHAGEAYLLSKKCDSRSPIVEKSVGDEYLFQDSGVYSTNMDWENKDWPEHKSIQFVAHVRGIIKNSVLVVTTKSGEESTSWSGIEFKDYLNDNSVTQKAYQCIYLAELDVEVDQVKSYVWLNESSGLHIIGYDAYYFPSNPFKGRLHNRLNR